MRLERAIGAKELIAKLQATGAGMVGFDFVKECAGRKVGDGFDVVAVTRYASRIANVVYATVHLGTPRMANGLDEFTLDDAEDEEVV